jgi:hypothetical protein
MQVKIKIWIIMKFQINHVLLYNELGKLQYFHKIFQEDRSNPSFAANEL